MECPKCGHIRGAEAPNPEWQCPACGIAYNKYKLSRVRETVKPLTAQQPMPGLFGQSSVWALTITNVFALLVAVWAGWALSELMYVYWSQSLLIGIGYMVRILNLEHYSTEDFRINNRSVAPTPETKRKTAAFFAMHFGFFHVVYLAFIGADMGVGALLSLGWVACVVSFGINHWFSFRYHLEQDKAGKPNIGTMMFTPYLRIVPMHLTIIFGSMLGSGVGLLLFGVLKTIADVLMHVVEHKRLAGRALSKGNH